MSVAWQPRGPEVLAFDADHLDMCAKHVKRERPGESRGWVSVLASDPMTVPSMTTRAWPDAECPDIKVATPGVGRTRAGACGLEPTRRSGLRVLARVKRLVRAQSGTSRKNEVIARHWP